MVSPSYQPEKVEAVKHPITYILVADGSRARLLSSQGINKPLKEVEGAQFHIELKPDRELQTDRPGRVQESANVARHAIERENLRRKQKEEFALKLANVLEECLSKKEYQRLIVAAPPEALGNIRAALSDGVRSLLFAEVPKDLTKMTSAEVHAHLSKELPL